MYKQLTAPDHVDAMHLKGKLTGGDIESYKTFLMEN